MRTFAWNATNHQAHHDQWNSGLKNSYFYHPLTLAVMSVSIASLVNGPVRLGCRQAIYVCLRLTYDLRSQGRLRLSSSFFSTKLLDPNILKAILFGISSSDGYPILLKVKGFREVVPLRSNLEFSPSLSWFNRFRVRRLNGRPTRFLPFHARVG